MKNPSRPRAFVSALFVRPETQVWMVIFLALGVVAAFTLLTPEWSTLRKLAGAVLMGAGSMMSVFMPRMIGGSDFN